MLSSPTTVYDSWVLSSTAEILTHYVTAMEFCSRDSRYSLAFPPGATLDPAASGRNRRLIM